jgi:hypothetical protein
MSIAADAATLGAMTEPASQLLPVAAIALIGAVVYGALAALALVLG